MGRLTLLLLLGGCSTLSMDSLLLVKEEVGFFPSPTRTFYPLHHMAVPESWPVREREILTNDAVGIRKEF